MCVLANLEYLSILFCAVFWAAAPDLVAVLPMRDSTYVWYCHVSGHWLSSGPWQESGPIWAFVVIPHHIGSLTAGIWARLIALHRMSFKWLWRCWLEALLRQDSPCSPRASTALPHTQVCGSQASEPNQPNYYYSSRSGSRRSPAAKRIFV